MLTLGRARHLVERALAEFAPEWEVADDCRELNVREPDDWLSGAGSYGVTLRQRNTGALKVIGKRRGADASAGYCRGVSFRVLEAYNERNTDPIVRFLQEVGIGTSTRPRPGGSRAATSGASARGGRAASAPSRHAGSPAHRAATAPPARPTVPAPEEETLSSLVSAANAAAVDTATLDRRGKSAGRGRLKKFLKLRPAMLKRLVKRGRSRGADVEVSGRVFTGSSPVLDLTRVTPTLSVNGKTVRLVLSFAGGEGVVVFECSRVVNAEFAGQTGEEALASILSVYGVGQLA